ncbi:MAG: formimidoylglutamate deiminase [Pseudomonadota bacterium]
MKTIWAEKALTTEGWAAGVRIDLGADGRIETITCDAGAEGYKAGILLPAPANLHSHSFQRAMAGMTEARGPDAHDSFWTWRALMYHFLDHLQPDDLEAIAAFAQMEMLEAGYAAVAEFHYVHHQPGGAPYDDVAELSNRIASAASETGIGLTLLPVLYEQGGCDGRPLEGGQLRFANNAENFSRLYESAAATIAGLPGDSRLGFAGHSLRAVSREGLTRSLSLAPKGPIHIHIAEQQAEVDEVKMAWGRRPVEWLFDNHDVDQRWCLVHAIQMEPHETKALAGSGAVAGLCPVTESNLGDGVFDGAHYFENNGRFGVGTDSNVRISLAEELRMLEYTQRLQEQARAVLATPETSTGRFLLEGAARGGAQAAGRNSGVIEVGRFADFIALDRNAINLFDKEEDAILDSYIFAGDDRLITDVWSAGRHVVTDGRHIKRDAITARYRSVLETLKARI